MCKGNHSNELFISTLNTAYIILGDDRLLRSSGFEVSLSINSVFFTELHSVCCRSILFEGEQSQIHTFPN